MTTKTISSSPSPRPGSSDPSALPLGALGSFESALPTAGHLGPLLPGRDLAQYEFDVHISTSDQGIDSVEPSAQRWSAELVCTVIDDDGFECDGLTVASASFWTASQYGTFHIWDVLDATSADAARHMVFFDEHGSFCDDLPVEGLGDGLVIVDRVSTKPQYRGRGFGPYLVAVALRSIASGRAVVTCEPAPFELANSDPGFAAEKDRLVELWSEFGFAEYSDGLFFMDTALQSFEDTVARALANADISMM